MKVDHRLLSFLAALLTVIAPARGLTISHIFGNHMVLQSGQPVPVWGWAIPGETIKVRLLKLPNTGMVVTTDLCDLKNMHSPRKKVIGERLACWAVAFHAPPSYGETKE